MSSGTSIVESKSYQKITKTRNKPMKQTQTLRIGRIIVTVMLTVLTFTSTQAQITFSSLSGSPYTQNFDALGSSGGAWTDNSTLLGWYAARGGGTGTMGPTAAYTASTGSSGTGAMYTFGVAGVNA